MWNVRLIPILVMAMALLTLFGQLSAQNNRSVVADSTVEGVMICPPEREPFVLRWVEPRYPKLALRAGLEGKVWVKVLVDKEGKPEQVAIVKSDAEVFNESAIEAAKQLLFVPATMSNSPVAMWVTVPFKFKPAERKDGQIK